MIIAISGTPGTGKTKAAKELAKKLGANLISIGSLVKKLGCRYDKKRRTRIVDVKKLQKAVNKRIDKNRLNIVEGHLAHLLRADRIIILRLNPKELRKRLMKRGWPKAKINENVEAEILDQITAEALQRQKKVFEINAGNRRLVTALARLCRPKILNSFLKMYQTGKVDWSERYKKELTKV
jgi:adenylate kinase